MKKFKLTKNSKVVNGITLHQIQALKDFSNVKKGDLGGWIEKEKNLSQEDSAWVSENARVSDNAQVYGDAEVYGDARVYGDAEVSDTLVYGDERMGFIKRTDEREYREYLKLKDKFEK